MWIAYFRFFEKSFFLVNLVVLDNRVSTAHDKNDINNLLSIQKRAIWAKFRELNVMTVVYLIAYKTVLFNKNIESIHRQNIHNFYNMMGRRLYGTIYTDSPMMDHLRLQFSVLK